MDRPHRRKNLLTGEWILVSPHRAKRPWQGRQEIPTQAATMAYDPQCYLCPGNTRVNGVQNPVYENTYVFDNDHPALLPADKIGAMNIGSELLQAQIVSGTAKVICFSPDHSQTLADMTNEAIVMVIDAWAQEISSLGKRYQWVQVFENKGEVMGCSNPHPHGQIWACEHLPDEAEKELVQQQIYFTQHQRPLLVDYMQLEIARQERVVVDNEDWLVVVPYWATWPYETLLLPKFTVKRLPDLTPEQRVSLASILKRLLTKYDNLFNVSFPYSMGWHGAPMDGQDHDEWQLHAHFYPPLLRSATVKKFMVGYEMLAEAQRDITAEQAAETLKALSDVGKG